MVGALAFSPNKGVAEQDLPPLEGQTGRSGLVSEVLGEKDSVPGFLSMLLRTRECASVALNWPDAFHRH